MIRVVVVDDHPVVRHGVTLMLQVHPDLEVVGAVHDAESGVRAVIELAPDVVLMDLSMPGRDGTSAIREITALDGRVAVVVLTSFSDPERIQEALDAGAVGYMLKDSEPRTLVNAVRAAARGESPLHPKAARVALRRRSTSAGPVDELTDREQEVLQLVTEGLTNGQIARRLGIAERTVKGHLTHVFERIGVTDRTSAAIWALRHLQSPGAC
jgi:DNA-binding NarL/FixJ family response regulator